MSQYRRVWTPGGTYFFTLVTHNRQSFFQNSICRDALRKAITDIKQQYAFEIHGWVLLPEHMHCIWQLPDGDSDYGKRWSLIKAGFSRRMHASGFKPNVVNASQNKRHEAGFWQRRFWEHLIKDEDDYRTHMDYLHYNPVKHGYVCTVQDWPFSSFHRLVNDGTYPDGWGGIPDSDSNISFGE